MTLVRQIQITVKSRRKNKSEYSIFWRKGKEKKLITKRTVYNCLKKDNFNLLANLKGDFFWFLSYDRLLARFFKVGVSRIALKKTAHRQLDRIVVDRRCSFTRLTHVTFDNARWFSFSHSCREKRMRFSFFSNMFFLSIIMYIYVRIYTYKYTYNAYIYVYTRIHVHVCHALDRFVFLSNPLLCFFVNFSSSLSLFLSIYSLILSSLFFPSSLSFLSFRDRSFYFFANVNRPKLLILLLRKVK